MERCVGTHTEGQARGLNRVQKIAAKFANNINGSGWETLAQRRLVADYAPLSRHTLADGFGKPREIDL